MSKGPLILWLLIELGRLFLTPAASETVRAFLGQSVILPCTYSSWSQNSNSMCWGKGECPKSKCNDELLHTNGRKVLSRKSSKYELRGSIRRGDVSLTIFNTNEGDSGVYCCRVEVPGWFNDVKKNIHLQLSRAPTTTHSTTHLPKATSAVRTATTALPTMPVNIPELTTRTPLQTRTTTALTTVATTCPPTRTLLPEATTVLPTAEFSTEGPILTAASETFFVSSDSERSTEVPSGNIALFTSQESEDWVLQSTSQVSKWEMSDSVTFPQTGVLTFKLYQRANHVYSEAARVLQFKKICEEAPDNMVQLLGELMNQSHASCRDMYECSCPEVDQLVDICRKFGAQGSRLTGAGWGGCTVSIVPADKLPSFLTNVHEAYYQRSDQDFTFEKQSLFATKPGGGALVFLEA